MASFLSPLLADTQDRLILTNQRHQQVLADLLEPAFDSESRRRGLLGRDDLRERTAVIIAPCSSIHTFFMRFSIDVIFAARDGRIVKVCHGLRPWRLAVAWGAFAAIEMRAGSLATTDSRPGDYLRVAPVDAAITT